MKRKSKAKWRKQLERFKRGFAPPYGVRWGCPDCNLILGGAEISEVQASEKLRKHRQKAHSILPVPSDRPQTAMGEQVSRNLEDLRAAIAELESNKNQTAPQVFVSSPGIPVERIPLKLLPPGTWDLEYVIAYYRQQAHRFPADIRDREIDWTRLDMIYKWLRPVRCYVGDEQWLGYVVFEFMGTDRVLLECPVKGNAIYVLWGDWKRMVAHTKVGRNINLSHMIVYLS